VLEIVLEGLLGTEPELLESLLLTAQAMCYVLIAHFLLGVTLPSMR
jgi:hypothetical protein